MMGVLEREKEKKGKSLKSPTVKGCRAYRQLWKTFLFEPVLSPKIDRKKKKFKVVAKPLVFFLPLF
jgi:hypothetical protein